MYCYGCGWEMDSASENENFCTHCLNCLIEYEGNIRHLFHAWAAAWKLEETDGTDEDSYVIDDRMSVAFEETDEKAVLHVFVRFIDETVSDIPVHPSLEDTILNRFHWLLYDLFPRQ